MVVTSTQFQQNVGYYLKLAEEGKEIIVEKLRPKGISFSIKLKENKGVNRRKKMLEEIKKEISKKRIQFRGSENSVDYQNSVRQ